MGSMNWSKEQQEGLVPSSRGWMGALGLCCPPILPCHVMNRTRTCRHGVHHEPPYAEVLCSPADPVLESTGKHLLLCSAPQSSLHQVPSAFGKSHLHPTAQILTHLPGTGQTLGGLWHPASTLSPMLVAMQMGKGKSLMLLLVREPERGEVIQESISTACLNAQPAKRYSQDLTRFPNYTETW